MGFTFKSITVRQRKNAKMLLIICCVFAVISFLLLIGMLASVPQLIKSNENARYLYAHCYEVDANISDYRINGGRPNRRGYFIVEIKYVNEFGRTYRCDFKYFTYKSYEERDEKENIIKQMYDDGDTFKMLIDDRGGCCLAKNKESLIKNTNTAITVSIICISAVVSCVGVFGMFRQVKELKRLKQYPESY